MPAYTPGAGSALCGTGWRLAVANPSPRPRPSPRTTAPSIHGSRPSSRAAAATSPPAIRSRILEDDTAVPPISTSGAGSTVKPSRAPAAVSVSTVPWARLP